jgi:hypothetical protein
MTRRSRCLLLILLGLWLAFVSPPTLYGWGVPVYVAIPLGFALAIVTPAAYWPAPRDRA